MDLVAVLAIGFGLSTVMFLIVTSATGQFVPLQFPPSRLEWTAVLFSCADRLGRITLLTLVAYTGPVFTSQKSYTAASGGVLWSILLLNEVFWWSISIALALICVGLYFEAKNPFAQTLLVSAEKN